MLCCSLRKNCNILLQTSLYRAGLAQEAEKVLDRLLIQGADGYVTRGRKFFEVQGTEDEAEFMQGLDPKNRTSAFVQKIPAAERVQIEQALRANGQPVTEQAILNLYTEVNQN